MSSSAIESATSHYITSLDASRNADVYGILWEALALFVGLLIIMFAAGKHLLDSASDSDDSTEESAENRDSQSIEIRYDSLPHFKFRQTKILEERFEWS